MEKKLIDFDIRYKNDINKGNIKVTCEYEWPIEILRWDCDNGNYPILAIIHNPNGKDFTLFYNHKGKYDSKNDDLYCPSLELKVVDDGSLFTNFEGKLAEIIHDYCTLNLNLNDYIKSHSQEVIDAAFNEFDFPFGYNLGLTGVQKTLDEFFVNTFQAYYRHAPINEIKELLLYYSKRIELQTLEECYSHINDNNIIEKFESHEDCN